MPSLIPFLQQNIGKKFADGSPSPMSKWLDGTLLAAEEGSLTVSFEVRPEMCNPFQMIHGGAVSAIIDDVMGTTVGVMGLETAYVSLSLNIDYLYSAKKGETVFCKSQVIRVGKKVVHIEAHVYDSENRTVAKAVSNMIAVSRKF